MRVFGMVRAAMAAGVFSVACTGPSWGAQVAWEPRDETQVVAGADFAAEPASADARYAADWVMRNADHLGRPFAIVDKRAARLYVFWADGRLAGATAVLIGLAPGDQSISGIASRTPASLMPAERTTPAGRYASEPGHNDKGEDIVWFDYDASLAIHRLRPALPAERRRERLESPQPEQRRISFGCVVVPVAFYDDVIAATLGRRHGVVYVLPEARPAAQMFGAPVLTSSLSAP